MERDCMTSKEADEVIADAKQRVWDGEDPEEVLWDGEDPDYIFGSLCTITGTTRSLI